ERKTLSHLAVDLIEEALEKPNQTIILEERIQQPISEPGIKDPTEQELDKIRADLMTTIAYLSLTPMYEFKLGNISKIKPIILENECVDRIVYVNNSEILYKTKFKEEN
ncbi:MAG: hypothetical protein KKA79_07345, partial [Nanoarchaeota archaeon]|nr:hypothetical protein [Nanoarchaeota archaeon]